MTKNEWMAGIIGLLLGIVLTVIVSVSYYSAHHNGRGMGDMMNTMSGQSSTTIDKSPMGKSMDDMMDALKNQSGDDFDQAFITQMIFHHQGAIDMANEAKTSAKHTEIKTMADNIITAQTKEITDMKSWYKNWYGTDWSDSGDVHGHGGMMSR